MTILQKNKQLMIFESININHKKISLSQVYFIKLKYYTNEVLIVDLKF